MNTMKVEVEALNKDGTGPFLVVVESGDRVLVLTVKEILDVQAAAPP